MVQQTIVAVYDTAAHAEEAVQELMKAGIVSSAIERHANTLSGAPAAGVQAPRAEPGFWASLFGGETDTYDRDVTSRSVQAGSTVVTVKATDADAEHVSTILDRHNPIDVEERGGTYGMKRDAMPMAGAAPMPVAGQMPAGKDDVLRLKEEQLNVGKRMVNKGTMRVRRFVVETPVTESVSLHSERAHIERRPATGTTTAADGDFAERTIEVRESDEEAVVSKTARVREEVVIRKEVADRTETVKDTVRREDVEITRDGDKQGSGMMKPAAKPLAAE